MVKERRGWDKNFPSTVTIEPGGYYVFDVTLKPEQWKNSPMLEKPTEHDGTPCRIRAIYSIEADEYSREEHAWTGIIEHAWTGTITSAERPYTIW